MELPINTILTGDALKTLKKLPSESVHCIVTSPPYWALRDYKVDGQIGQEETPQKYIRKMVKIFREARRILINDGVMFLNIGDTYFGGKGTNGATIAYSGLGNTINKKAPIATSPDTIRPNDRKQKGLKPKDLVGVPWRLAFALQADGWYLRQDIIWSKPNPMPESVTDRCTKSHEYIFLLSKSGTYYYDAYAIRTPAKQSSINRLNQDINNQAGSVRVPGKTNGPMKAVGKVDKQRGHGRLHAGFNERWDNMTTAEQMSLGANKRSVWEVATYPFSEAHFATFPPELIIDCIKAGCPKEGIVLDPFIGAGTTGLVARKLGRKYIGIELNPEYVKMANGRLKKELGMFQ